MKRNRKFYFIVFCIVLMLGCLLILNACSPSTEEIKTKEPENLEESSVKEGPRHGGAVVFGDTVEPVLLMPCAGGPANAVGGIIYQGLVRSGPGFEPLPNLAESWHVSEDGLTVQFNLRKGVKFHDGTPFTSADVKFTLEEIVAVHHPRGSAMMKLVNSIETPDDHTVILNFSQPYGPLFSILGYDAGIVPKHIYAGIDVLTDPLALQNAVGTGPFKLVEWKRNEYIVLERFDDYWDQPKPYLDQLIIRFIPDSTTLGHAIESGEIDVINYVRLDVNMAKRLQKNPEIEINYTIGAPQETFIQPNHKNKYLANKEVRKAIYHAIDREYINEAVYEGMGTPAKSAINPIFSNFYNPEVDYNKMYPYDPQKAEQILDDAGFPRGSDGIRFKLRLISLAAVPAHGPISEIIKVNLRDIGIEVEHEALDDAMVIEKVFKNHDFDMQLQSATATSDPTMGVQRFYRGDEYGTGKPFVNASGYANDKVDELFQKAATTVDIDKRAEYFFAVQKIIAEDLPLFHLVHNPNVDAKRTRVQGFWMGSNYMDWWDHVWVED